MNPLLSALVQAGLVAPDDAKRIARQLDSNLARSDAEAEMLQAWQVALSTQRDRLVDAVRANDGFLTAAQSNKLWAGENDRLWQSVRGTILDLASERATVAAIHGGNVDMWHVVNDHAVAYAEHYYTSTAADNVGSIPNLNITSRQSVGRIIAEWQQGILPASGMDGLPELIHNLTPVFGASRAQTIGVTETSRIFADSERQAAIANPFVTHLLWQTANDEKTCPICLPLNGQVVGKETDGFQIPEGFGFPPAHVSCRCGITSLTDPALSALREQGLASDAPVEDAATPEPVAPAPVEQAVVTEAEQMRGHLLELSGRATDNTDDEQYNQLQARISSINARQQELDAGWQAHGFSGPNFEAERQEFNNLMFDKHDAEQALKPLVADAEKRELARAAEYRKALAVDNPTSLTVVSREAKMPKAWTTAMKDVSRMIDASVVPPQPIQMAATRGRGYYDRGVLFATKSAAKSESLTAHELGHWMEHKIPGVYDKAIAFRDSRTQGESTTHLGAGFGADEYTKKDKFISTYMGKIYRTPDTEIVSMGIEFMYKDAAQLARDDPEYFDFIYNLLRGK